MLISWTQELQHDATFDASSLTLDEYEAEVKRRANRGVPVMFGDCVLIDDYGTGWYRCHWTKEIFPVTEMTFVGGYLPSSNLRFLSGPTHQAAKRESARVFADSERNCNTCRNLERVKHPKDAYGFLIGKCPKAPPLPFLGLYVSDVPGTFSFHPHDPMHLACYESRFDAP